MFAAASMGMTFSPFFTRTRPKSKSCRAMCGLVNCTGEMAWIADQLVDRSADQVHRGLAARAQQQEHHRDHFAGADAVALLLDANEFRDQPGGHRQVTGSRLARNNSLACRLSRARQD